MRTTVAAVLLVSCVSIEALAGPPPRTSPRVYGPTGRLYGPTQAEYQYQRQYGRPWDGRYGNFAGPGAGYANGYPWPGGACYHAGSPFFGPVIYPPVYVDGYFPIYGSFGYAPSWPLLNPVDTSLPLEHQAAMQQWLEQEQQSWDSPLESLPVKELPRRFIKPSSDAAKLRSVRLQHEGDLHFQNLEYGRAAQEYQQAHAAAPDRPDPYFRLGVIEAARGNFANAILQFKLGLQLAPDWPSTGDRFDDLIGEHNVLAKTQIKQRVIDWLRQDIRDPDRLFLMGALLHLDGDDRARILFETAARLGGPKQHLQAYLAAADGELRADAPAEPDAELRDDAGDEAPLDEAAPSGPRLEGSQPRREPPIPPPPPNSQ